MRYLKNHDKIIEFFVTLVMSVIILLACGGLVFISSIFRE